MRIAFVIIWTLGIGYLFGYYYATTYHRSPSASLTIGVSLGAWFSALGIVYLWHKAKKDKDRNTPGSWL